MGRIMHSDYCAPLGLLALAVPHTQGVALGFNMAAPLVLKNPNLQNLRAALEGKTV